MLVLDVDTDEKNSKFNVTNSTTNFVIGFFGFYKYYMASRFERFLKSTDVKDVANHDKNPIDLFTLDGNYALEAHDQSGGGTFDPTIILPKTFNSEKEALDQFNDKLSNQIHLSKSEIFSIKVLDGDEILKEVKKEVSNNKTKNLIINEIKEKLKTLKKEMLKEHSVDEEYIIKNAFEDIMEVLPE